MKVLCERILKEGKCFEGGILKVDKFINHQMDPNLMKQIAVEFIRRYASTEINKIITLLYQKNILQKKIRFYL